MSLEDRFYCSYKIIGVYAAGLYIIVCDKNILSSDKSSRFQFPLALVYIMKDRKMVKL